MATIRPKDQPAASSVQAGDIFLIDGATGVRALDAATVLTTGNIGAATGTSLALGGTTLGNANLSVPTQIRIGSTNAVGAALLIDSTLVDSGSHADVAAIQLSPLIPATITGDAAGIFIAPTVATGAVLTDLASVRAELPVLAGSATLGIYKGFRADDVTSLTVGTSKWAFFAEGVSDGGKAQLGRTTINSDGVAITVGRGTVGDNTAIGVNGGASGSGAGPYIFLLGGGTNQSFIGAHSAIFSGAYNGSLSLTSISTKPIELCPGLTGTAFSQTVTTTFNVSGGVGIGTATDPGAGGLVLTAGVTPGSFTVGTLPAGVTGKTVFCSNVRVFNGAGTQEGAAAGTGGLVTYNGTAWKVEGTNITAVA